MKPATILIVEDNPVTLKMVRFALQSAGYAVETASTGAAAIAVVRKTMPDLILQDLVLPDTNGFDLVEEIRALPGGGEVIILAFTGFVSRDEDVRISAARFDGLLIKPVEPSRLIVTIEEYLSRTVAPSANAVRGTRALLVDDDPTTLLHHQVQLERFGYKVTTAADGQAALDKARKKPPAVVLADILMPRMDGFQLVAAMRADAALAGVPVVLISSHYVGEEDRELARRVGAQALVPRAHAFDVIAKALAEAIAAGVTPTSTEDVAAALREDYPSRIIAQLERQAASNVDLIQRSALQAAALGVLGAIAEALSRRANVEHALDEILAQCVDAAGLSRGAVLLRQPEGAHHCVSQLGFDHGIADIVAFFAPGTELAAIVSRGVAAVLTPEATGAALDLLVRAGASSALVAPIASGPEGLGVLVLTSATKLLTGNEWKGFAQAVASQLGQALVLSRTFAQLADSEERFRGLFEGMPVGLLRTSPDGTILEANPTLVRRLGYPDRASLLRVNVRTLYAHAADRDRFIGLLERDGLVRSFVTRIRCRDGSEVWVELNASLARDAQGRIQHIEGSVLDISERIEAEAALRNAESRLQHVLAATPAVIYLLEFHGAEIRQVWVSENISQMLNYSVDEATQPTWFPNGLHPDDREWVLAKTPEIAETGRASREYRFQHKDGSYRWILDEQRLTRDGTGAPTGIVGAWMDITARKSLEAQLGHAMKMEAVGQLAGGVAHDFNNLLAVITVFTELVSGDMEPGDQRREDLEQVQEAAKRATALTRQLLAFSRQQVLQPVKLDPNVSVANLGKMLGRLLGEDIDLVQDLAPDAGLILADPGQLEQVIMNLVVNARDAMPTGGRIVVATRPVRLTDDKAAAMGFARGGAFVRLSVSDSGTGMTPEVLRRVFEPFFTTKENKGTGLGLATVYGIVRQSEGHIAVTSTIGEGSRFTMHFPSTGAGAGDASGAAAPGATGGSETILLVEDDLAVQRAASRALKRLGYAVIAADSGDAALIAAGRHTGPIHLLLADVVMPGINTQTLLDRLRGSYPELKAVYMSGYAGDAVTRRGVLESGVSFLQKPFTMQALGQRIREVLDRREAGPPGHPPKGT